MRVLNTLLGVLMLLSLTTGCASMQAAMERAAEEQRQKAAFYNAHMPTSILVLPPTNQSIEPNASYAYLSTVTAPLANRGYYVFPVALVDGLMKENGLPHPEDMHDVPISKLREVINADAVMYINITNFGQKFELISSDTKVSATAKLVHSLTGNEIWKNNVRISIESDDADGGGLLGDIIHAAVTQAVVDANAELFKASKAANTELFGTLPIGPRHRMYVPAEPQVSEPLANPTN